MKKILTALMLCFVSIMFVACDGGQLKSSTQNASESTDGWEYLGAVHCFEGGESKYEGTIYHLGTGLWAKPIGGETYYKAGWPGKEYVLSPNPLYDEDCEAGEARYKFVMNGKDVYVIF